MKRRIVLFCFVLAVLATLIASPYTLAKDPYEIAVIVKATESDYWQVVMNGAKAAAKKLGNRVDVSYHGPASDLDMEKQVSITENIIARRPDAIVVASATDGIIAPLERAYAMGIKVIILDTAVNTSKYHSFLATDNVKGGALAAEKLVEAIKATGKPLKGKVGVISAMGGLPVLMDRFSGFETRLKQLAPGISLIKRYIDADPIKGLSATLDLITANKDIVGFFGDYNGAGDGIARALIEKGLGGKIAAVSYDSDDEEIKAILSGVLYSIVVQDPYGMGYKGVMYSVDALDGKAIPKNVDTGVWAVTKANFNDPLIQGLLYPSKRQMD